MLTSATSSRADENIPSWPDLPQEYPCVANLYSFKVWLRLTHCPHQPTCFQIRPRTQRKYSSRVRGIQWKSVYHAYPLQISPSNISRFYHSIFPMYLQYTRQNASQFKHIPGPHQFAAPRIDTPLPDNTAHVPSPYVSRCHSI